MRRFMLWASFAALVALLGALWAYRFERSPQWPVWRLADLRAAAPAMAGVEWTGSAEHPVLRVRLPAEDGSPQLAARFALPGMPPLDMLHMQFRLSSRGLLPGPEPWADGRIMVEWHPPDGIGAHDWETDYCASARGDERGELQQFVIHPRRAPAIPTLRVEHLGRAGYFELSQLELTVVRERPIWKFAKWWLAGAWLAWGVACVKSWPGIRWWRALAASAVALAMGVACVVPGPWKIQRPMGAAFHLGPPAPDPPPPPVAQQAPAAQHTVIASGTLPALGKLPEQGSWVLQVKRRLTQARPLLHMLLLFAPTLAIAWLAGRQPALCLATILALAIECAQIAFGYGFDWIDVFDLTFDAAGIALALWLKNLTNCGQRP